MKKKIIIGTLTFIGIITTIKLALIYYNANFNPYALSSFCSINDFIDCDGIAQTNESQFFGIPLAYWGLFLYCFIMLMLFVDKLKNIKLLKFLEVFKNPYSYIGALGLISFIISMILLSLSLFDIKKLCILCAFTYVLNLLIACVACDFSIKKLADSIKQSVLDFVDAIKIKAYLAAFICVLIVAGAGLTYTTKTMIFAPQVKRQIEQKEFFSATENIYAQTGNVLGNPNPRVTVYIYSDYQCPVCYMHNIMMHKLAKELKDVLFVHKNYPLDNECNKNLTNPMHPGACLDARYSIAAEKQDKLWDMNDILFQEKPTVEYNILEAAKEKGFDVEKLEKDANSPDTLKQLESEIDEANSKGVIGTPTVVIGDKVYTGMKHYDDYIDIIKNAK